MVLLTYTGVSKWKLLETGIAESSKKKKSEAMNSAPPTSGEQLLQHQYQQKGRLGFCGFPACLRHTHGCSAESTAWEQEKGEGCLYLRKTHIQELLQQTVAHHSLTVYSHTRIITAVTVN